MWADSKIIAYLKALLALAWADGELSNQELNCLKNIALKFRLPAWAWTELTPYLEEPVTPQEAQDLLKNFLALINSPKEKQLLLDSLREIANADKNISPAEKEFLGETVQLLENTSRLDMLKGSLKGLLNRSLLSSQKPSRAAADFSQNKILYKLERRIERGELAPVAAERLKYLALFGGILGRVAYADRDFSAPEQNLLKQELSRLGSFTPQEVELIATVVQESILKGVENVRLTTDFFHLSNRQQRLHLLDSLFALAAADGKMSNQEIEEIRAVAHALQLTHKEFIAAKLKHLPKHE